MLKIIVSIVIALSLWEAIKFIIGKLIDDAKKREKIRQDAIVAALLTTLDSPFASSKKNEY